MKAELRNKRTEIFQGATETAKLYVSTFTLGYWDGNTYVTGEIELRKFNSEVTLKDGDMIEIQGGNE